MRSTSRVEGVAAYVLVADPSFLAESVRAYYQHVQRIIVSYDRAATSWTGTRLPVAQCLEIIRSIDYDKKCVEVPGDFARSGFSAMANDTYQRQQALDAASEQARWVVQLDTDEVMQHPSVFFRCLANAESLGASGMDFPSRWLYSRSAERTYLELTSRFWRHRSGYPGPLAVRAGTTLKLARQIDTELYRVDIRKRNTDPSHPSDAPVHEVVRLKDSVLHFSWVRDVDTMRRKLAWSGHASELSSPAIFDEWQSAIQHPHRRALASLIPGREWYRVSSIKEPPGGSPITVDLSKPPDGSGP